MIPVIDIFAGPGGLGEGFASCRLPGSKRGAFRLAVSIEKDPIAHQTLRLRALRRQFGNVPSVYQRFTEGAADWAAIATAYPRQALEADREAICLELGAANDHAVQEAVRPKIPRDDKWVLIGGPPCQAYSLAGRARNKGVKGYRAEADARQTLYVEYLQLLADYAPPVFVMENVKGLLSAKLNAEHLFHRILEDLGDPAEAMRRERRRVGSRSPRYDIRAIVTPAASATNSPEDFVVRAERFGIPQRRHRVILVGVRSDIDAGRLGVLREQEDQPSVGGALHGLPELRSGLSKETDTDEAWKRALHGFSTRRWFKRAAPEVQQEIQSALASLKIPDAGRGGNRIFAEGGQAIFNHASRSHILADLERYLFVSAYGAAFETSPKLSDFPSDLLPKHDNVSAALHGGMFADRFRVQIATQPSTTITSHISKDGHYYIHPDPSQCRSMTVREAARLQTFPDDYFFCGPRTSQYHQVGNAVPPALARQIARLVAPLLE